MFQSLGLKRGERLKHPVTPVPADVEAANTGTRKLGIAVDINRINEMFGLTNKQNNLNKGGG